MEEYTGTHQIVLPKNFLQSADAAAELYEEQLSAVDRNLEVEQFRTSPAQRLAASTAVGVAIWLVPAAWMTCG